MKILLITILFLHTGIGMTQNLEITVLNKNSQTMPYAYILINNKPVEVEAFNDEPDMNNNVHRVSLKFDCELFTHENPKRKMIYLPVNVHYCYEVVNQMKFDLKISDVSIKYKKF